MGFLTRDPDRRWRRKLAATRSGRIVVFDPDLITRETSLSALRESGHRAIGSGDLLSLMGALLEQRCDLVLAETAVAFDAAARIRALAGEAASTPLILLCWSASPEIRTRAELADLDGVLARPVTAGAITRLLTLFPGPGLIEPAELNEIEDEDQGDETANKIDRGHGIPRPMDRL